MKFKISRIRVVLFLLVILIGFVAILIIRNRVDNTISDEDIVYIRKIIDISPSASPDRTYEQEIEMIKAVQNAVLTAAPLDQAIADTKLREVKDLYENKAGLCYDRSRVIEKILRFYGFETRHIFVLSLKETNSTVVSLITPQEPTHAVSGVKTKKGWLVVDSNTRWISVDTENNPKSMNDLMRILNGEINVSFNEAVPQVYRDLAPFTYYFGLYSRDGKFYPPYHYVPNLQFGELKYNFSE